VAAEISSRQNNSYSTTGWERLKYKRLAQSYQLRPARYCTYSVTYYDSAGRVLEQLDIKASYRAVTPGSMYANAHEALFGYLGLL